MLNAKKIKIHGMKSRRWTIKDKLTQYKGLLNLYRRDRKILEFDTNISRKKQIGELRQLQKNIIECREELDNAIRGDRQQLRNCLQEHKSLQLAYQDLHPTKVIDHLHQDNFNKRKELDRYKNRMKQKSERLTILKLEKAELEDRLKMEAMFGKIPSEQLAEIITGKVQDAILKKEAAICVRNSYRSILNIMKQDSIYFDAVLNTLKQDVTAQGKCMFRTTELGQLATEYLDDRQDEFLSLEKTIKQELKFRRTALEEMQQKADQTSHNLRYLIRRDSDITVLNRSASLTSNEIEIFEEVERLEEILKRLRTTFTVTQFESLIPCLEEQRKQSDRLLDFSKETKERRDIVLNKFYHANKMYNTLFFTMADTTLDYKTRKKELLEQIALEVKRKETTQTKIIYRGDLLVQIRKTLQLIYQICKHVTDSTDRPQYMTIEANKDDFVHIEIIDPDAKSLLEKIARRLAVLVQIAPPKLSERAFFESNIAYMKMVHQYTRVFNPLQEHFYESLVEVSLDNSKVPTRDFIKTQSKEICQANTVVDLDSVKVPPKKKRIYKF